MKSNLFTLLFASLILFLCSELKAQDEPCVLPTYDVTAPFAPGEVAFDLFEALTNDGYDFFNVGYCSGWIGDGSVCFFSDFVVNEAFIPLGFCAISQWDILLSPNATQEECCGEHVLPYYLSYNGAAGAMVVCEGLLNLTIDCGQDCGLIDFSDPALSPVSDANGDGTTMPVECIKVCENSSLVALAPVFGSGFTYTWDVQGGTMGPNGNPELDVLWGPHGAGNISVTITNTDPNFTPITYSICIEILEGPEALFSSTGNACLDSPIQFTDLSSSGATNYFWEFGDNQSFSSVGSTNPAHTYNTPGLYDVTLTVYSDILGPEGNVLCTCSDTYTEQVLVDSLVGPDIQCVSTLCENDTSSYFTNAELCQQYIWTVFDSNGIDITSTIQGQNTPEIFVQWGLGPYGTVVLEVVGCPDDYCTTPTSVQIPIIPANGSINGPNVVCEGEVVSYDLTKWASVDYDWTVIGGTIINQEGSVVTIQWNNAGPGVIDVTYTSEFLQNLPGHTPNDCTGFATLNVDVRPKFYISPSPFDVCIGETTVFTAYDNNGASSAAFDWTNSGPFPQTAISGNSISITWTSSGNHSVTATLNAANPDLYCNSSATAFVTVHEVAAPTAITGPIEVCANSPSYIYEVAASQGLNAIWTPSATTGVPSANPYVGLYTEVTWGATGPFALEVEYQMADAPYCNSDPFTLIVEELTLDPLLEITSTDAPCANETADYSLSGIHPDATIHWTINLPQYGSVIAGQGTENITIQWNDIPSSTQSVTITATAELCGNQTLYTKVINLNRAIVPIVVGTDFCVGTSGTVEVTNPASFSGLGGFDWGCSGCNTSTINPTSAGDYIVNTIDINGCPSSGGATIGILPAPMLNLTTNGPNTLVDGNPSSTEIVAPYNPDYAYIWSPPATTSTITHTWQGGILPSTYTYTLTVTEISSGCTNTESINIYEVGVISDPCVGNCCTLESFTPPQIDTPSLSGGYCDTWGFLHSGSSSNVTGISWAFGDFSGSSSNPTTHTYTEIGYYNVSISGQVPNAAGTQLCPVLFETVPVDVAMIAQFGTDVSCVPNPTDAPQLCLTDETAYLPGTSLNSINFTVVPGSGSSSVSPACFGSLTPGSAYTANLTATHSSGCIDDFTQAVTIPGPVIISATPPVLCLEQTADFTAICSGAVSFDWNFDDSAVGGTDAVFDGDSPQHSYAQNSFTNALNGPYTPNVSVVATHANGCQFTDNISLVVNDLPPTETITSLDGDFKFCYGGSEILEVISAFDVFWWMVDPIGGPWPQYSPTLTVTTEGEYYAQIFDSNTGCETFLDPVLVQQWPLVPAFITGPSILCEGECTELLAPSGNYLFEWYNLAGNLLGTTNSIEVCSNQISGTGGTDTFTLKVLDPISGCNNSYDLVITVEPNPVVILGTFPDPPCEGAEVTIFVDNYDGGANDYVWTGGQTGNQFTTLSEGIYTVVAIDKITGCKGYATETVHPCPNLCEVATGCYTACDSLGKTVCGPLGLSSYQWNFTPSGSNTTQIFAYTQCITMYQAGDYSLTATNIYGCPKTSGNLEMEFISCDSCQFAYADMIDLQLQSLGTSLYSTDIDGDGVNEDVSCCVWSIDPIISTANGADPSTLCMDIIWGDGFQDLNVSLGSPVEHCYTDECTDYLIDVKIRCCDGSNSHGYTATASCDCIPNCYIKNSFWESITEIVGADKCHIEFTGNQFLGPDMDSYQNPIYIISGIDNNGNNVNISSLDYGGGVNFSFDLNPGVYQVCYTIEGLSLTGDLCTSEHCHEVVVDCCGSTTIDPCLLPENIVFFPEVGTFGTSCEDGCEWHFCLGVNSDFDDSHCFTWDFDDGTSYSSNNAECAIHCFNQSGTYNVCLTVYCCDDPTLYIQYCETIVVNCGGSGGGCEYDQTMVDFDWGTNSTCANGCDEVWFCASDFGMDANTCISWDFGDGNSYSPALPECPIHCYNSPGVYTACLTVYCCEEGPDGLSAYTICHQVVVSCDGGIGGCTDPVACNYDPNATYDDGSCEYCSCGAIQCDCFIDCPEFEAGLGLVNLGTSTDAAGASCCEYGLVPTLLSDTCQIDLFDLCINVNWGDGSAPLLNAAFPVGYTHCFPSGGSYIVTMEVYCCLDDGATSQVWTFTDSVTCTGGGCDLPAIDFEWGRNGACANTGCDEIWFCATNFIGDDPNVCLSWDFGDGNIYNPPLPECPIHCYNSAGVYNACLTVYCCEEGPSGPSAYTICHDVVVSCGCVADCPDFNASLGLISLGTGTDASGASCCEYGLVPTLLSECQIELFDLCINVDWGDGSAPMLNTVFPEGYTHCFPTGGSYTVTMDVYCCADGAESQSWTFTDTVICTGSGCEYDPTMVDFEWGTNSNCPNGCDEVWFCASDIGNDPNLCMSWDFGDGSVYNPGLPECPIHCYSSAGVYNACLTVYCCDEGPLGPSAYEVCHEVIVSCNGTGGGCLADCPDFNAGLGLVNFGPSTDASGTSCCEYGLVPTLLSECQIDLFDLCINVDWGDGSAPMQNASFPHGFIHCFPTGGTYTVTMDVYCCADGADSQTWTFTDTVTCEGGGVCEFDPTIVDFEWGTNSNCPNGCDEVWFCASNIGNDPNVCMSWDFGDGNVYNPGLPECPIHCYSSPGTYNACLTVYCCEAVLSPTYTICHEVIVSCGEVEGGCPGDYDLDGFIGVVDLLELLGAYGAPCE
jgi:PKD repeat protein